MDLKLKLSKDEYNTILPELLLIQKKLGNFKYIENSDKYINIIN